MMPSMWLLKFAYRCEFIAKGVRGKNYTYTEQCKRRVVPRATLHGPFCSAITNQEVGQQGTLASIHPTHQQPCSCYDYRTNARARRSLVPGDTVAQQPRGELHAHSLPFLFGGGRNGCSACGGTTRGGAWSTARSRRRRGRSSGSSRFTLLAPVVIGLNSGSLQTTTTCIA